MRPWPAVLVLTCGLFAQSTPPPPDAVLIAPPNYPPLARQARIQGKTVVTIALDSQGTVVDAKPRYGHPILLPGVVDSVKKWKFDCRVAACSDEFTIEFDFVEAGTEQDELGAVITLELPRKVTITVHPPLINHRSAPALRPGAP